MEKSHPTGRLVRFGVFEVDLRAGELHKNGLKIKLQEQPFQILAMLLEKPGGIITREEVQQKLWSNDTFVDFDNSLNKAVNKIREALGDSADNPRFVETMARRGYRFIAPVDGAVTTGEVLKSAVTVIAPTSTRRRLVALAIGVGVVLAIASVGVTWWLMRPSSPPAPKHILTRLTSDTGLTRDPALSSDGRLLAYASDRSGEGNLDIWLKPVAGGEPLRLTRHEADDSQPSFSPDGSQIAFRSKREGGGIYIMSSLVGDERLIANEGFNPRFSPDGRWILYETKSDKIYVVPSSGGRPRQLAPDFHTALSTTWAPDGKHFLFFGVREKVLLDGANFLDFGDLWVAALDGGPAIKTGASKAFKQAGLRPYFISAPSRSFGPVWSSKGDQLLFTAQLADSRNVWQIPIFTKTWQVTGDPQQLTFGTGLDGHPSVTTDGRLVFASVILNHDIWSLSLDANQGKVSGEMQRLTRNAAADVASDLSEDGRKLLFVSNRSGNDDVWLKDLESGKERPVTATPSNEIWPKMTADGSKVSYEAREENDKAVIYVLPVGGGVPEKVCEDCAGPWQWSPDGNSFLYRIPPDNVDRVGLFILRTGKKTELLRHPRYAINGAKFSPDNRWIAFLAAEGSVRADGGRLFIVRFRGEEELKEGEWIALADGTTLNNLPQWSLDGNLLYFASRRDGFLCIWAQRLEPATKHPLGSAFPVYHFHRAELELFGDIAVARGKIVFTLVELTGNIWMTTLRK